MGIRLIHLFKNDWDNIHDYIEDKWNPIEPVVAYIRDGDEGKLIENYKSKECKVVPHPAGYRSIHYIISTQVTKDKVISEIQVRTIFEEGWSEIDHKVRYPNYSDNKLVAYILTIFNRFAGAADEMGLFVNELVKEISVYENNIKNQKNKISNQFSKIEDLIEELSISENKNKSEQEKVVKIKNELERIKQNSIQLPSYSSSDFLKAAESVNISNNAMLRNLFSNSMGSMLKNMDKTVNNKK